MTTSVIFILVIFWEKNDLFRQQKNRFELWEEDSSVDILRGKRTIGKLVKKSFPISIGKLSIKFCEFFPSFIKVLSAKCVSDSIRKKNTFTYYAIKRWQISLSDSKSKKEPEQSTKEYSKSQISLKSVFI